jgi:hypothetical protein
LSQSALTVSEITDAHPPERLIEIIQNLNGSHSKEDRDTALILLIKRFHYLITKVKKTLYFAYELHKQQWQYEMKDFGHDVLTEFIDLVVNDFRIKEDLENKELAVFGNYIKVKLYRRVQYHLQLRLKKAGYEKEVLADFEVALNTLLRDPTEQKKHRGGMLGQEIRDAVLQNIMSYDDLVLDNMIETECQTLLKEIMLIAEKVLDHRECIVWKLYYLSGLTVNEIGQHVVSKTDNESPLSRHRCSQIARESNDRVLREYGRRAGMRRVNI